MEKPTNGGFLTISDRSLVSQFTQFESEIAESLWHLFEIFPFCGRLARDGCDPYWAVWAAVSFEQICAGACLLSVAKQKCRGQVAMSESDPKRTSSAGTKARPCAGGLSSSCKVLCERLGRAMRGLRADVLRSTAGTSIIACQESRHKNP
jgi:hypothetical protein